MIDFTLLSDQERIRAGFGFNGNILETNVLNLAVVIGIVVSFGGDALRSLLENRKQNILKSLQEADFRAQEGKEKLLKAKSQLLFSKQKSIEIREEGRTTAEKERKQSVCQTREDVQRLEQVKEETLQMEEQKTIRRVSQQVVLLALNKARNKLKIPLDSSFHLSVNECHLTLFRKYKVH